MDAYTRLTKAWLDQRYALRASDPPYFAHEPIFGLGSPHSEPFHACRVVRLYQQLRRVRDSGARTLLDVGASEGYFAALCRELFDMQVVAVDLSLEACRRATELFALPACAIDAASLPFASQSFDIVTCAEVVEHLSRPVPAILELQRVARLCVVISTEEWKDSEGERDRHLAARILEPHGERNSFCDVDLPVLFAPYEVSVEPEVVPDSTRFPDLDFDRQALQQCLSGLQRLPRAEQGETAKGRVLVVHKAKTPPAHGISDSKILSRLLQPQSPPHPWPSARSVPWPEHCALICPHCGAPLQQTHEAAQCANCARTWPRHHGILCFDSPATSIRATVDQAIATRGGAAYPGQSRALVELHHKLQHEFAPPREFDFRKETTWGEWRAIDLQPLGEGRALSLSQDPRLELHWLGLPWSEVHGLELHCAIEPSPDRDEAPEPVDLFWCHEGQRDFCDEQSIRFHVPRDGRVHALQQVVPRSTDRQLLLRLRIDPASRAGVQFRLLRLRVL